MHGNSNIKKDPGVDGRIILNWIFQTSDAKAWSALILFRIKRVGGLL